VLNIVTMFVNLAKQSQSKRTLLYERSSKQNGNDVGCNCTEYQLQYKLSCIVNQLLHLQTKQS